MGNPTILETKLRQNEQIYTEACSVFGGEPHVFRYYDQSDEISVDLLTVEGAPLPDVVSYSTLGLIHYPRLTADEEAPQENAKPRRVELAGACRKKYEYLPNLLSQCAFDIVGARFSCRHGSVYRDIVNTYIQGSPLRHVLFAAVGGVWKRPLPQLEFADKTVLWLNAIPISDQELAYLEACSTEELLRRFQESRIDPYHWERASVL